MQKFEGLHRCIYVDRFYTSTSLMQELDKMNLYVTGICMKNRLPKELRIEKRSQTFKDMSRGNFISHTYEYVTANGNIAKNMG